ncbi:unnamed protein product [Urochloa humidicola]
MASIPIDPRPHAPRGFEVIPHDPAAPPLRLSVHLGGCMDPFNEDVAIAMLVPAVAKEDFDLMAPSLKDYFIHAHRVRLMEVQPCAMGDAYVRFMSPLERERFLGKVYQFGPHYQVHFIKHDEAMNATLQDIDREAWVMLMGFPLDARKNVEIAKVVSGFGLLRYWYDTSYEARIVVRVLLNDDAKILQDVVVTVGVPPKARSWTYPVFALKKKSITMLPDEEPILPNGPLHPLPAGPLRWMGPNPDDPSSVAQSPQANAEHSEAEGELTLMLQWTLRWMGMWNSEATLDAGAPPAFNQPATDLQKTTTDMATEAQPEHMMAVNSAPSSALAQVTRPPGSHLASSFFFHLNLLDIDPDTLIPPYLVDPNILVYLARLPDSQLGRVVFGPALPPRGIKLVSFEDSDDEEDFELKKIEGPILSAAPKKCRAGKMKALLEDSFVRCSKCLNPEVGGFHDAASAQAAQDYPIIYAKALAVVPPEQDDLPPAAPHLLVDCIQSIDVGFLQMQPSVVSTTALLDLDDE